MGIERVRRIRLPHGRVLESQALSERGLQLHRNSGGVFDLRPRPGLTHAEVSALPSSARELGLRVHADRHGYYFDGSVFVDVPTADRRGARVPISRLRQSLAGETLIVEPSEVDPLDALGAELESYRPHHPLDAVALTALRAAYEAARQGNYGVGAVLRDRAGQVLFVQGNTSRPMRGADGKMVTLDGGAHAESNLMDQSEARVRAHVAEHGELRDAAELLGAHTVLATLEPCMMCSQRLLSAGLEQVFWLAPDLATGLAHRPEAFPPVFEDIASRRTWRQVHHDGSAGRVVRARESSEQPSHDGVAEEPEVGATLVRLGQEIYEAGPHAASMRTGPPHGEAH